MLKANAANQFKDATLKILVLSKIENLKKTSAVDQRKLLYLQKESHEKFEAIHNILLARIEECKNLIFLLEKKVEIKTKNWVIFSGTHSTVGGAASEDLAITGVTTEMTCVANITVEGASSVTLKTSKCGIDKITFKCSADPSNDHEIEYLIIKK